MKERKKVQLKVDLFTVLNTFSSVSNDKSLDELLNIAEKQLKDIRELLNKQNHLKSSISELNEKIRGHENEIKDNNKEIERWDTEWIQAIKDTNISVKTSTTVAEKMLFQYEECAQAYDAFVNIEKEQQSIQEQIVLFTERVNQLLITVELSLDEQNPDIAVNKLNTLLQKGKEDQVAQEKLNEQYEILQSKLKDAQEGIDGSQDILNDLFNKANCQNLEELKEVEKSFIIRKGYVQNLQIIEEEMFNLGNGKSIQELVEEAGQHDSDCIEGELDEIERELESTEANRSKLEQAYGVVKKEYEEKVQGNNMESVQVEQERTGVHAKLATLTDQYIQLKLAAILLQKGIEDYRNRNQNPIIRRAGEIFKKLTLHSFIDLTVDYDEKDEPILMGVRENGEKVAIDGMSDGTTDQLYLSLRIASIEKYVEENESIPFIVDDILVHFDDDRSQETLKILLELSKHTQIIFFTHHYRLIDIMKEITEETEYQVIEINHQDPVLSYRLK